MKCKERILEHLLLSVENNPELSFAEILINLDIVKYNLMDSNCEYKVVFDFQINDEDMLEQIENSDLIINNL